MKAKIIAHRGASSEGPENTLSAIRTALSLNVDCVEIDVRLCKEGIPLLFHDLTLSRVTRIRYAPHLHKLELVHIRQIDAGSHFHRAFKGESIPTLEQVLNLEWGKTSLMIEIKTGKDAPEKIVKAVLDVIQNMRCPLPNLIIGGFSLDVVSMLIERQSSCKIPYSIIGIAEKLPMISSFVDLGVKHLALWHRILTPNLIDSLHEKGIEIWSFTVNSSKLAKHLISLSVNGIITNDPRKMLKH